MLLPKEPVFLILLKYLNLIGPMFLKSVLCEDIIDFYPNAFYIWWQGTLGKNIRL